MKDFFRKNYEKMIYTVAAITAILIIIFGLLGWYGVFLATFFSGLAAMLLVFLVVAVVEG